MNRNVRHPGYWGLHLLTLFCFIQFSVINDGYTFFLSSVQAPRPAGSFSTILFLTQDVHERMAFRSVVSVAAETRRVVTQVTLKSLSIIKSLVKSIGSRDSNPSSIPVWRNFADQFAPGSRVLSKQENYLGGKKESWTKFDAPRVEKSVALHLNAWKNLFSEESF